MLQVGATGKRETERVVERKVDVMDLTNEPTMSISYILNHYV
jgi:hypothetical protein